MNLNSMTVEEFSTPSPIKVDIKTKLPEVWNLMQKEKIRHVLVGTEETVLGVLSERDLTTFSQSDDFGKYEAQDVMSRGVFTVSPETKLYEVALKMSEDKIGSAVVADPDSEYIGIFTSTDALNALVEVLRGDFKDN